MGRVTRFRFSHPVLGAVCAILVSCSGGQTGAEPDAPSAAADGARQAPAGENAMDIERQVAIARADLAGRLGIDPGDISIESAKHVNWQSGAAGCPQPDMNYPAVITPGVLILLRADTRTYRYHGTRSGAPFHCPPGRAEAPAFGQGEEAM